MSENKPILCYGKTILGNEIPLRGKGITAINPEEPGLLTISCTDGRVGERSNG